MNWQKLCEFVDKNRNVIPPETPIVSTGEYGEVDCNLTGLQFKPVLDSTWRSGELVNVVVLGGMPSSYQLND
jgi:hypothetical protein